MLHDDGSLSLLGQMTAAWLACSLVVFLGVLAWRWDVGDAGHVKAANLEDLLCEVTALLIVYLVIPLLGPVTLIAVVWTLAQVLLESRVPALRT